MLQGQRQGAMERVLLCTPACKGAGVVFDYTLKSVELVYH
jgi:hypothetical protein